MAVPQHVMKTARRPPQDGLPSTPPASDVRQSTPKFDTDRWLEAVKKSQDPDYNSRAMQIELPQEHYHQALRALEQESTLCGFFHDKLRSDYDPQAGIFSIRMPTPIHDVFSTSVANEIHSQLQQIARQPDNDGAFAAHIVSGGSSRILLQDAGDGNASRPVNPILRHPDAQFQHQKAAYPGVVLEVSYSQDGKDLEKLAWQYIQHSNGDIKAVIGIDINYNGDASTVSLWRPEYTRHAGEELDILGVKREVASQPIRSPDCSSPSQAQVLRLPLSDFATDALCPESGSTSVSLPYKLLAKLLKKAEDIQAARENGPGAGVKSKRKLKRRKRSSSPADRILTDDEAEIRSKENKAEEKLIVWDTDFRPAVRRKA